MRVEEEYASKLVALAHRYFALFSELREAMPRLLARAELDFARQDAGETEIARRLIEEARSKIGPTMRPDDVRALAILAGQRTSIAQRADLMKQIRSGLGVEVQLEERRTREQLINFANQNAQLISTIPTRMLDQVAALTMRAFQKRMSPETYAAELQKIADLSDAQARNIARDQIATLTAQLARERHAELGIVGYYWISMRDENVRPKHERNDRASQNGKVFLYASPPADTGNPGDEWGCRCMAKPDLSPVLKAIAAQQVHARPVR